MKKLFVKTYGCQMNAYDSAKMADLLAPLGYARAEGPEGADMVILNTCHIRERAAEKVYSELGRLKVLKAQKAKDGGRMVLAVAAALPRPRAKRSWRVRRWWTWWWGHNPTTACRK
jgi:tRNA-2-methylthio-N6-dimethylallyladenosine synthase